MKVCLLAPGDTLVRWQADALAHLLANTDAEVTTVVYEDYERDRTPVDLVKRGVQLREWAVVGTLNNALVDRPPQLDRVRLDTVIDPDEVAETTVEPAIVDGWKREIPDETARRVGAEADVAVRFAFGFLVGPALSSFEHGVLSFHHGDLREYRGQPMALWEFVNGEDAVGITVQQITEQLDGGAIAALKRVDVTDQRTWEAIKARLFAESEDMLTSAIRNIESGEVREPDTLGTLKSHPTGRPVATFTVKNLAGHVRDLLATD